MNLDDSYPNLLDMLSAIQTEKVSITTNLDQSAKWWCAFIDATEHFHEVSVVANWQRPSIDVEKYRKQFADKAFLLIAHHMSVNVTLAMLPALWDDLYADARVFYDRGLDVSLKAVEGVYTDEQLRLLETAFPPRAWVRAPSNRPC